MSQAQKDDILTPMTATFIHPTAEVSTEAFVGDGCKVWRQAHIREHAVVGAGSIIGAGSVVTRDVPDHALVFGQPAKIRGWVCMCARRVELRRTGDGIEGWCAECQQAVRLPAEAATIGR